MRIPKPRFKVNLKSLKPNLKDPKVKLRFILYLSAFFVVILIISGWSMYFTSSPQFCSSCHNMRPYIESWERSSHSNIPCYGCHGQRGVFQWMYYKTLDLKTVVAKATDNYERPINAESKLSEELKTEVCNYCHNVEKRNVTPIKDIKINHKKHLDKGINCTKCHNRVAHDSVKGFEGEKEANQRITVFLGKVIKLGVYPNHMKMRYCMRCHKNGKGKFKAPGACTTCHPDNFKFKPPSHFVKGFFPRQLPGGRVNSLHRVGGKLDKQYCLSCHNEKKLCTNCHGTTMPHGDNWAGGKNLHSVVGKKNKNTCQKCHAGANFCNQCHHGRFGTKLVNYWWSKIPGLTTHRYAVDAEGTDRCFKCHGPLFCAKCHTTGELPFQQ